MVILITGGTGFLGGNLIDEVIENQDEWGINPKDLRVLVRKSSDVDRLKQLGLELAVGDLGNSESLKKAMKDVSIVLHAGAVVLDQSPPDLLQKINVEGTKCLAEAFMNEDSTEKFVYVSTWGVYGYNVKPKPLKEDQKFDPTNQYHKSKAEAEAILWKYYQENGLPISVARKPMIMGPGDTLTSTRVIQALFDDKVIMIGKGKNLFSGIHVRDAARAILTMGKKKEAKGKAFNVKSFDVSQKDYWNVHAKAISVPEVPRRFPYWLAYIYALSKEISAKLRGKGKATVTRHRVMRYGNSRILDISKIRNELGWEPKYTDGNQIIIGTVKWLVDNGFVDFEQKKVRLVRRWEEVKKA